LTHYPNQDLADTLLEVLAFPGVRADHPEALKAALTLWANQGPLSFADCCHLALTKSRGLETVFSFDRKMDRYPGVARVEP